MIDRYVPKERTSPAIRDGFDTEPAESVVKDGDVLIVYRAHGDSSKMIGRFFFTPVIAGVPRINWTAELLERELNAALWGNDFKHLAKFQVHVGVKYRIGPIAQDSYQGVERRRTASGMVEEPFDQYSYFKTAGLFHQVQIDMQGDWRTYLDLLEDAPVNPGNFVARGGNC